MTYDILNSRIALAYIYIIAIGTYRERTDVTITLLYKMLSSRPSALIMITNIVYIKILYVLVDIYIY